MITTHKRPIAALLTLVILYAYVMTGSPGMLVAYAAALEPVEVDLSDPRGRYDNAISTDGQNPTLSWYAFVNEVNNDPNNGSGKTYTLHRDIVINFTDNNAHTSFIRTFSGTLDGGFHTVYLHGTLINSFDMYQNTTDKINVDNNVGMIRHLRNGTVRNLRIKTLANGTYEEARLSHDGDKTYMGEVVIDATDLWHGRAADTKGGTLIYGAGLLVGMMDGNSTVSQVEAMGGLRVIYNPNMINSNNGIPASQTTLAVGGIVGYMVGYSLSRIERCHNEIDVTVQVSGEYAGGNIDDDGENRNLAFASLAGGVVGGILDNYLATVTDCFSSGTISNTAASSMSRLEVRKPSLVKITEMITYQAYSGGIVGGIIPGILYNIPSIQEDAGNWISAGHRNGSGAISNNASVASSITTSAQITDIRKKNDTEADTTQTANVFAGSGSIIGYSIDIGYMTGWSNNRGFVPAGTGIRANAPAATSSLTIPNKYSSNSGGEYTSPAGLFVYRDISNTNSSYFPKAGTTGAICTAYTDKDALAAAMVNSNMQVWESGGRHGFRLKWRVWDRTDTIVIDAVRQPANNDYTITLKKDNNQPLTAGDNVRFKLGYTINWRPASPTGATIQWTEIPDKQPRANVTIQDAPPSGVSYYYQIATFPPSVPSPAAIYPDWSVYTGPIDVSASLGSSVYVFAQNSGVYANGMNQSSLVSFALPATPPAPLPSDAVSLTKTGTGNAAQSRSDETLPASESEAFPYQGGSFLLGAEFLKDNGRAMNGYTYESIDVETGNVPITLTAWFEKTKPYPETKKATYTVTPDNVRPAAPKVSPLPGSSDIDDITLELVGIPGGEQANYEIYYTQTYDAVGTAPGTSESGSTKKYTGTPIPFTTGQSVMTIRAVVVRKDTGVVSMESKAIYTSLDRQKRNPLQLEVAPDATSTTRQSFNEATYYNENHVFYFKHPDLSDSEFRNGTVYYTFDGSTPSSTSPSTFQYVFEQGLTRNNGLSGEASVTLKAFYRSAGYPDSETATFQIRFKKTAGMPRYWVYYEDEVSSGVTERVDAVHNALRTQGAKLSVQAAEADFPTGFELRDDPADSSQKAVFLDPASFPDIRQAVEANNRTAALEAYRKLLPRIFYSVSYTGTDPSATPTQEAIVMVPNVYDKNSNLLIAEDIGTQLPLEGNEGQELRIRLQSKSRPGLLDFDDGQVSEPISFIIRGQLAPPTATPDHNSRITLNSKISLFTSEANALIYYTVDGPDPEVIWTPPDAANPNWRYEPANADTLLYSGPISVPDTASGNLLIKAVTVSRDNSRGSSSQASFLYVLEDRPSAVSASPAAGEVLQGTQVRLNPNTEGATVYYEIAYDGAEPSDPTQQSNHYSEAVPIVVERETWIKAVAYKDGVISDVISSFRYTVASKVAVPVPDIPGGRVVERGTTLTLSSGTSGASIIYTTDGSDPANAGNPNRRYGSSIVLNTAATATATSVTASTSAPMPRRPA